MSGANVEGGSGAMGRSLGEPVSGHAPDQRIRVTIEHAMSMLRNVDDGNYEMPYGAYVMIRDLLEIVQQSGREGHDSDA